MANLKQPTYFISHGGGPWPFISEMREGLTKTLDWMKHFAENLPERPTAILSISAHWQEDEFTVSTAKNPTMIYDYSGFPEHTYKIQYPALGAPTLAARVQELLTNAKIAIKTNAARGFDHGTFVPLSLMFPKADIPVVSMSIRKKYNPRDHILMGEALSPLRDEGVLIIGSGLSYHNMREFGLKSGTVASQKFGEWLGQTISLANTEERNRQLENWEQAPAARLAHPTEDHLIPLMTVVGAAKNDVGRVVLIDHAMSVDMATYQFG
jgi:aromatic ring-opening dioxygenase catalytic subunit (LigB family)